MSDHLIIMLQRKRKEDRKFESPHKMCNAPETIHNDPSLPIYPDIVPLCSLDLYISIIYRYKAHVTGICYIIVLDAEVVRVLVLIFNVL